MNVSWIWYDIIEYHSVQSERSTGADLRWWYASYDLKVLKIVFTRLDVNVVNLITIVRWVVKLVVQVQSLWNTVQLFASSDVKKVFTMLLSYLWFGSFQQFFIFLFTIINTRFFMMNHFFSYYQLSQFSILIIWFKFENEFLSLAPFVLQHHQLTITSQLQCVVIEQSIWNCFK